MTQQRLGDYINLEYGKGLAKEARGVGSVPVFGSGGIIDRHNKALIQNEGIIVGRKGTIGSVQWSSAPFYPIDTTYYVTLKGDEVRLRYIYFLLKTLPLSRMNTDVAVPGLNRQNALQLPVMIKSLQEQDKIIDILSTYDNLIENNRRRIELLEKAAHLLYKEWFIKRRFPNHQTTPTTDGLPEGCEKKTLGEIDIARGRTITKNATREGTVPVVAGGLTPSYYHDTANVSAPVITVSASGANAGYVNLYHEDIWASDCSYISNAATEYIYFYYALLKSKQTEITALQKGAAQPHVYPKDLRRLQFTASDNTMRLYQDKVADNFNQIRVLLRQNQLLIKSRDIILPRLMAGN